ncbi:MAG: starch synthase [Chloroflexi bacterium]|nr:MAG: starch synthase [Chloroflexota bacterium]MBA4374768.1 hypothetical protein [Anaerolinea sp.]
MPFVQDEAVEKNDSIHVLFIAAEADPYVKIGGLGDVAGSLPLALHRLYNADIFQQKLDIRLVLPYYGVIQQQDLTVKKVCSFSVQTNKDPVQAEVYETTKEGLIIYFVSGDPIPPGDPVYNQNFSADADKFIFFSLACLELPKVLGWRVDILHVHDWHTAIAVHQLKMIKKRDSFYKKSRSIITLHNLPFMGNGSEQALVKYKIKPSTDPTLPDWAQYLPLPMGFAAADQIVAVSPAYAQEILTPEFSCNLHDFFESNQKKLSGILNGLDTILWNPSTDSFIHQTYDRNSLGKKRLNKSEIQKEMGLVENPETPLIVLISRMDTQKGIDIAIEALKLTKNLPWQAILLGSGDIKLEQLCQSLEDQLPDKVRARVSFDPKLSHRMYAGGDMLLMPSRYEPCGLTQMIAMRYGCIPVARATGGLKDSIIDNEKSLERTGFLFETADPQAFAKSLTTALVCFDKNSEWIEIQQRAMQTDFSWAHSAVKYSRLYNRLVIKQ